MNDEQKKFVTFLYNLSENSNLVNSSLTEQEFEKEMMGIEQGENKFVEDKMENMAKLFLISRNKQLNNTFEEYAKMRELYSSYCCWKDVTDFLENQKEGLYNARLNIRDLDASSIIQRYIGEYSNLC